MPIGKQPIDLYLANGRLPPLTARVLPLKNQLLGLLMLATWAGCSVWPFAAEERTSIITPSMRTSMVREIGARASHVDSNEQQRITDQLAQQIRTEPDPLVRVAIQETVAEFDTVLAQMILLAGLNDTDRDVRIVCCRKLGQRGEKNGIRDTDQQQIVAKLQRVLEQDKEIDVRFAAVDAMGQIQTTDSVQALASALHDHDPAMQYAGVQALKRVSGQDFGNDVEAWRQYADGKSPQIRPARSVAQRMKEMMPF
jgi:hypothetical protein